MLPDDTGFHPGDRVFYVLPRSLRSGRPETLYWPATVRRVTSQRVVIVLDGRNPYPRNTVTRLLAMEVPPGAAIKQF